MIESNSSIQYERKSTATRADKALQSYLYPVKKNKGVRIQKIACFVLELLGSLPNLSYDNQLGINLHLARLEKRNFQRCELLANELLTDPAPFRPTVRLAKTRRFVEQVERAYKSAYYLALRKTKLSDKRLRGKSIRKMRQTVENNIHNFHHFLESTLKSLGFDGFTKLFKKIIVAHHKKLCENDGVLPVKNVKKKQSTTGQISYTHNYKVSRLIKRI